MILSPTSTLTLTPRRHGPVTDEGLKCPLYKNKGLRTRKEKGGAHNPRSPLSFGAHPDNELRTGWVVWRR